MKEPKSKTPQSQGRRSDIRRTKSVSLYSASVVGNLLNKADTSLTLIDVLSTRKDR